MKSLIPLLNPNDILRQFSRIEVPLQQKYAGESERFLIDRIERANQLIKMPIPPHRKTFHDFFFLTQGTLVRGKGIDNYTVSAGEFFVMPAYQITTNDFNSSDIRGFFCAFGNDVFAQILVNADLITHFSFLSANAKPVITVPPSEQAFIVSVLEKMERDYLSSYPNKYELMAACLLVLFREMNRVITTNLPSARVERPMNAAQRITQQFKNEVEQHGKKAMRVSDYANRLSITPNHFNKAVRHVTGRTAMAWIDDRLILEAKVPLAQTTLSVASVALELGLEDDSYFGRFFRQKTKQTPTNYRKWIDLSEL